MNQDDGEIVRASISHPELFEAVFDRHHRRIWTYLARLGGRDCADELAGDVFLVAFARRHRYEPSRGSVPAWLYGIASNRFRTRHRSQLRAARAFRRAQAQQSPALSPTDDVVDALASREQLQRVIDAMAQLSFTERQIILLYAWERLSYEAIATVLQLELGTVRSRLARARQRLRELAGISGEVSDDGHRPGRPERKVHDG